MTRDIEDELQYLWTQQLMEYQESKSLEAKLAANRQRIQELGHQIEQLLAQTRKAG